MIQVQLGGQTVAMQVYNTTLGGVRGLLDADVAQDIAARAAKAANLSDLSDADAATNNLRLLQSGTGATAESLRTAVRRLGMFPEQYGAAADGTTNDATAVQRAMTAAAAANVPLHFTPGKTYKVSTGLTAPAGLEIVGYGATLQTAANITLLTLTTGCVVRGLKFVGPSSTYHTDSKGVYFSGTVNGAGVAPTFITGVKLIDCQWDQFGYLAIQPRYDDGTEVINPRITNCGYGGIITEGSKNFIGKGGYFDTFTGETGTGDLEAMAISWSCADNETDHVRYPPATNCVWEGGLFKNCPTWAVLDTHGGVDCHFVSPVIIDCRRAVFLVSRLNAGPKRCSATNVVAVNTFASGATNSNGSSKRDIAFLISGDGASYLADDCHISGKATNFGSNLTSNPVAAAGLVRSNDKCSLDVIVIDPEGAGVSVDTEARGHIRAVIQNPHSTGSGAATVSPCYVKVDATGTDALSVTFDVEMKRVVTAPYNAAPYNYVGVRALVSSGALPNMRLTFKRLTYTPGVDMSLGSDVGTVAGVYPVTYAADVTGFSNLSDTSVTLVRDGGDMVITLPFTTGTSDATGFVIGTTTPLPTYARPASDQMLFVRVLDDSNAKVGYITIATTGVITVYPDALGSNWTASGTKRLFAITGRYSIN